MEAVGLLLPLPVIHPPDRPPLPPEAQPDWISIGGQGCLSDGVVLALSFVAPKKPMRAKEIVARVAAIPAQRLQWKYRKPRLIRLDGDVIKRAEDGWSLLKPERAAILHRDLLWGSPGIFSKQELAAHRREAVLHIIGCFPAGLQTSQIIEQLRGCRWVQAPISKELVQDDMELLDEEKEE